LKMKFFLHAGKTCSRPQDGDGEREQRSKTDRQVGPTLQ
jgi:hypothetical protein